MYAISIFLIMCGFGYFFQLTADHGVSAILLCNIILHSGIVGGMIGWIHGRSFQRAASLEQQRQAEEYREVNPWR